MKKPSEEGVESVAAGVPTEADQFVAAPVAIDAAVELCPICRINPDPRICDGNLPCRVVRTSWLNKDFVTFGKGCRKSSNVVPIPIGTAIIQHTALLNVTRRVLPIKAIAIVPLLDDLIGLSDLRLEPVQHSLYLLVSGYPPTQSRSFGSSGREPFSLVRLLLPFQYPATYQFNLALSSPLTLFFIVVPVKVNLINEGV